MSLFCVWVSMLGPMPGCAADTTAPADSAALHRAILAEIGEAGCDSDVQCRTIAIGAKACGGPQAYLAYSIKGTSEDRLHRLVARQREAQKAELARSGLVSDCAMVSDPGAVCTAPPQGGSKACRQGRGDAASLR